MQFSKVLLLWIYLSAIVENVSSLFKLTNLKCESFNESWVVYKECRLRAIKRDITVANMVADFLYPAYEIDLRVEIFKKANGYKPFLFNVTVDCCSFMKKRNNPVIAILLDLFKDYTNINHTCPYVGPQIVTGFYPRHELLKLPLPNGEYALWLTWYLHSKKTFLDIVYWTFDEK